MVKLNKLFLALAAFAILGLAAPAARADDCTVAGNLVTNCGFETGTFTGWTPVGDQTFNGVQGGIQHSGSFGAFFGPVGSLGGISQNLATVAGGQYNLSFWLQTDGGTPSEYRITFNGVTLTDVVNPPAFGYTLFTFNNLVATGISSTLEFTFRDDPGFIFLDDVVVVPAGSARTPEPATMLLLGSGLAGLGMRLRRRRALK